MALRAEEGTRRMFGIALDAQGRIFAANGELLTYDGYRLTKLPLPSSAPVGAVAVDNSGRVWTGNGDDLGYFTSQPTGGWAFTSVREHLPADARDFDRLWEIFCLGRTVFFVTSQHLLIWREDKFVVHHLPNQRRLFASVVGGTCYVWQRKKLPLDRPTNTTTLWKFDEAGQATPIPDIFYGVIPPVRVLGEDESGIDVVLNTAHRRRIREGKLWPEPGVLPEEASFAVITADLLPSGETIMGTNFRGIHRYSASGELQWRAGVTSKELPDDSIEALVLDRRHRAWVVSPNALSALDTTGIITTWPSDDGWPNAIYTIARVDGALLIGSAMGLHRLEPADDGSIANLVRHFKSNPHVVQSMLVSTRLGFVIAGQSFNYVRGPVPQQLSPDAHTTGRSVLHLPGDDRVLIFADLHGIAALQDPATVATPPTAPTSPWSSVWQHPVRSLDRAYPGIEGEVIVSNIAGEVTSFKLARRNDRLEEVEPPRICTPPGGIGRIVNAQQWGDRHYLFTRNAVWSRGRGEADFAHLQTDGAEVYPFAFTPSETGDAWVIAELRAPWRDETSPPVNAIYRAKVAVDGTLHRLDEAPVAVVDNIGLLTAQFRESGVWWLGGTGGLARIDLAKLEMQAPERLIDRPIFTAGIGEQGEALVLGAPLSLKGSRHLRLEFSFPRHLHSLTIKLQSRLAPLESTWTTHADAARRRDISALPAGDYKLEVRALDLAGQASPSTVWPFVIEPRFTETIWYRAALAGLALALFAAGAGIWTWRLRRRRDELTRQVAERTTALVEANQELHRLNARRVEFVGVISHELRTPLLGATFLASQLAEGQDSSGTAAKLHHCLQDLQTMLEGTMDLSRYELGLIPVHPAWAAPKDLLNSLVDVFRPLAEAKGIALDARVSRGAERTLLLDLTNFRRLAANLVSNAVKYTPTGSVSIDLRLDSLDDGSELLVLVVTDTGIGMDPAHLERISAEFQRPAWNEAQGGSHGLGLALTKRLVDLAGGTLTCSSTPGRGSEFVARLPVISRAPDDPEHPFDLSAIILEDERSHLEHAQDLLEPLGITVHSYENIAQLNAGRLPAQVDLVILDFNLPDGTGLDAFSRLQGRWARAPRWVLLSALRSPAMHDLCAAAGFDAILGKPLSFGGALAQARLAARR